MQAWSDRQPSFEIRALGSINSCNNWPVASSAWRDLNGDLQPKLQSGWSLFMSDSLLHHCERWWMLSIKLGQLQGLCNAYSLPPAAMCHPTLHCGHVSWQPRSSLGWGLGFVSSGQMEEVAGVCGGEILLLQTEFLSSCKHQGKRKEQASKADLLSILLMVSNHFQLKFPYVSLYLCI